MKFSLDSHYYSLSAAYGWSAPVPESGDGRSRVLERGEVLRVTELLHLVIPVASDGRGTHHQRGQGGAVCMGCGLLGGGRGGEGRGLEQCSLQRIKAQ